MTICSYQATLIPEKLGDYHRVRWGAVGSGEIPRYGSVITIFVVELKIAVIAVVGRSHKIAPVSSCPTSQLSTSIAEWPPLLDWTRLVNAWRLDWLLDRPPLRPACTLLPALN